LDPLATAATLRAKVCSGKLNWLGKTPRPLRVRRVSTESECQIHEIWRLPVYCGLLVCCCYESKTLAFKLVVLCVFNPLSSLL